MSTRYPFFFCGSSILEGVAKWVSLCDMAEAYTPKKESGRPSPMAQVLPNCSTERKEKIFQEKLKE